MIDSVVSQQIPPEKFREELYKKVSAKLGVSLEEVEKVIIFQFSDARAATNEFAVIELSKLCKFLINQSKLKKVQKQYADKVEKIKADLATCSEARKRRLEIDLKFFSDNLSYLGTKFREELPATKHKENNRRRKEALAKAVQEEVSELDEAI